MTTIDTQTEIRLVYDVRLRPVIGSRFQPTGFPDIGAATFERFEGDGQDKRVASLLVESVQSMANRLEATAWDAGAHRPVELFEGLPYVRVHRASEPDEYLTSSRVEAHRLASAYVYEAQLDGRKMRDVIGERLGLAKDTPLDYAHMARALMALDPFCLIHGVFFSRKEWLGNPKFARAVSAFIEAYEVERAISGGRKADQVRHSLEGSAGGTAEGYGSVPFHRTEWTARDMVASFCVDVELLRSYRLPDPATELLTTIALWEIRALLCGGMRLRTACDLEPVGPVEVRRGAELPDLDALTGQIRELVPACRERLGHGEPLTVLWKG
ncbi:MAG: type I-G CRISPR-associated RAMP protein Csb1/Cas7g [Nocardioidaceae bacterium]